MMDGLIHWIAMGGYARYVWLAYATFFAIFIAQVVHAKKQKKRLVNKLKHWIKSE